MKKVYLSAVVGLLAASAAVALAAPAWAHRNHLCDYDNWRHQYWGYNYGYPGLPSPYYNQGLSPYYGGYPYNAGVIIYPEGQTPETSTYDWPYATGLYGYSLAY
jgi:hypothetical protein